MYTLKEKALILADRSKEFLAAAKTDDNNILYNKFGIVGHSNVEDLTTAIQAIIKLAVEMKADIDVRIIEEANLIAESNKESDSDETVN